MVSGQEQGERVPTHVAKAVSVVALDKVRPQKLQRRNDVQSSQPMVCVTDILVQRRMVTNKHEITGERMQVSTIASCWLDGSGSIAMSKTMLSSARCEVRRSCDDRLSIADEEQWRGSRGLMFNIYSLCKEA